MTDLEQRVDEVLRAYIVEDGQAAGKPKPRLEARASARAKIMALFAPAIREAQRLREINDEEGVRDPDLNLIAGEATSVLDAAIAPKRDFDPRPRLRTAYAHVEGKGPPVAGLKERVETGGPFANGDEQ